MLKKTVTALSIAALAGVGALSVLPDAVKAAGQDTMTQLAACKPCGPTAAKKACGPCGACGPKKACGACSPCGPCGPKKACGACSPCGPCGPKKKN